MVRYPEIPGIVIDGELGRGAHSVVYSGRHHGRRCAVKLPRAKARWTRWIYREAVALARVKDSLLPAVLEVGEVDGLPYLVMDLVQGVTLAEKLAEGPLDEDTAIRIGRQLASVLGAVHDAGLVHRDVKPRNIVVDLPSGGLKLVDFGFATPMERIGASETAGTAAYAAPEQLTPPGNVDGRSDLYALGRVLFECSSSQPVARRGIDGPWGPEARAALVARGVSPAFAEVVAGLLRHSPAERYPTARSLTSDLDRLREGLPILGPKAYPQRNAVTHVVAREVELERVLGPCRDLSGGGAVVIVRGARGSGKSRLLGAAEAHARSFARTIAISCTEDDPPLSALRRIIDAYCAEHVDDIRGVAADDLRAAIGNLAPVAQLIAPLRMTPLLQRGAEAVAPPGIPSHVVGPADSLVEGAAEILLRLALRVGPVVIVVDDVQWMDPASTDALVRVGHRAGEAPVALVLGARPIAGTVDRFSGLRAARMTEVELPRVSAENVAEIVASHLGEVARDLDPTLVARIHAMAGGTPLGVLEVLGAFLDAGAVRPHNHTWRFDPERTDRVILPRGALVLLGRRLGELPAATRRVLETAAIVGTSFEDATLAVAVELLEDDLGFALASARRAGLLEADEVGRHRFVHDSLREMLVEELTDDERRRLHQRVAEVLDTHGDLSFEERCAAARHFAAGQKGKDPARAYRAARAAGDAAVARFDNETAFVFLTQARVAAEASGNRLDSAFHRSMGEVQLRLGRADESRLSFESALQCAYERATRAILLGRLSWVHQTKAEPDQAWQTLGRAFKELGHRMPSEDVTSAVMTSARLARGRLGRVLTRPTRMAPSEIDLLCELHYQNARLGMEYAKPARIVQSSLAALELSERGGAPATRIRARALYALVITFLGGRQTGPREMMRAKAMAEQHADAATMAFCVQLQAVAASWAGELDESLVLFRECVDIHGPWLEVNEYCQDVISGDLIQSMRGRAQDAWLWMERAVERLRRSRTRPVVADFLIHRVRATLAAIGRVVTDDPWLADQLETASPRDPGHGYHRLLSWGPRARYYLETGDLGAEFEELVSAFQAEGHNPRSVHLALAEYYLSVAHARAHQIVRAAPPARAALIPALRAAVKDFGACAKIPLLKAHHLAAEGYLAWLDGQPRAARKHLADAEALANQQNCPWVLYAVARARAHILRAAGKEEAARDQARAARLFAREHGAVTRVRWIDEEFGLTNIAPVVQSPTPASSQGSSSSRANRQLTALLQVVRAPRRDLKTEQQASAILDELIDSLGAERGAILFQPEPGTVGTTIARHRASESSVVVTADSARGDVLRGVHQSGMSWPPLDAILRTSSDDHPFDPSRVVAVPLFLYEKPVGALSIERNAADMPFEPDDRNLLVLLSHQVPIALEIARLLFEREQLHASLQHAKKMEAMGALAGGLAHDFNNMLAAIRVAVNAAQERAALDQELTVDLDIIAQATTRAAQLTGQLLSFSRHQPVPVSVHDVNQLISTLEPMLRRVVGGLVEVSVKLSPAADAVEVDQGSFDQALVNLFINARDAMPAGGSLSISTRNVVLGETAAQRANLSAGEYVEVKVTDTGEGMSAETQSRIFEPFFTTKAAGTGSGLGLAMVYAFARNCGGSIEVASELGQGTTFRLYLRRFVGVRTRPTRNTAPVLSSPELKKDLPDTILVVDDDDLVRRSIAKILERNGYRVIAANGSTEALTAAREQGTRIGLVILDVLMPGVTGPELGRRLYELKLPAKLLFVSGYSPENLPIEEPQIAAEMWLQKPFSQSALLERVRQLMHS